MSREAAVLIFVIAFLLLVIVGGLIETRRRK